MLFVYLLENHPVYAKRVQFIRQRMMTRRDRLFTSTLAAGEVLVGPKKTGDAAGFTKVESYFRSTSLTLLPFSTDAIEHYARLRAVELIRPPDAIHLACAAAEGVDVFITNDKNLNGMTVPGIQFIVGLDTDLF